MRANDRLGGVAPDFSPGERVFKPAETLRQQAEGFSPGVRNPQEKRLQNQGENWVLYQSTT
jgi:hypothetical protein